MVRRLLCLFTRVLDWLFSFVRFVDLEAYVRFEWTWLWGFFVFLSIRRGERWNYR